MVTPGGQPMAMANSNCRLLHHAESGGANDWKIVHVPGGGFVSFSEALARPIRNG